MYHNADHIAIVSHHMLQRSTLTIFIIQSNKILFRN